MIVFLFLLLYSFGALIDAHAKRVPASTAVCAIDFNGHLVCSSFVPKSKVAIALLRNVDFLLCALNLILKLFWRANNQPTCMPSFGKASVPTRVLVLRRSVRSRHESMKYSAAPKSSKLE